MATASRHWFVRATLAPLALAAMGNAAQALVISRAPTSGVTCDAGICSSYTQDAVFNVGDVQRMLRQGDLQIFAGGGSYIEIDTALHWSAAYRLTLASPGTTVFNAKVTVEGAGAVEIDHPMIFAGNGKLDFWD